MATDLPDTHRMAMPNRVRSEHSYEPPVNAVPIARILRIHNVEQV